MEEDSRGVVESSVLALHASNMYSELRKREAGLRKISLNSGSPLTISAIWG